MKIVATSDTHFPFAKYRIPPGDVFLHAGDLMYTGYPDEWYPLVGCLKALEHPVKLLVPGNHDFHIDNYCGVAKSELRGAGVSLVGVHQPIVEIEDIKLLGIPFVTGLNGWAFGQLTEETLLRYLRQVQTLGIPDIVVSHMPLRGVLDALHPEEASNRKRELCGSRALRTWFDELPRKPKHWFCGHIHESYGTAELDGCRFYNVSMCDRDYAQTNPPMVIEV